MAELQPQVDYGYKFSKTQGKSESVGYMELKIKNTVYFISMYKLCATYPYTVKCINW